jgi:hypothetical protein
MTTYKMVLILEDFPHISLSNSENRTSLAIIVLEIFKKHRGPLYFGGDSSLFFSKIDPFSFTYMYRVAKNVLPGGYSSNGK